MAGTGRVYVVGIFEDGPRVMSCRRYAVGGYKPHSEWQWHPLHSHAASETRYYTTVGRAKAAMKRALKAKFYALPTMGLMRVEFWVREPNVPMGFYVESSVTMGRDAVVGSKR